MKRSQKANVPVQKNAPATANEAKSPTSRKPSAPSQPKSEEDVSKPESSPVKKQRGRPKKGGSSASDLKKQDNTEDKSSVIGSFKEGESSTSIPQQVDAAKDTSSAKGGSMKGKKASTGKDQQQASLKDEAPRKRGRPKKGTGPTGVTKSRRTPRQSPPNTRGRAKERLRR